MPTDEKPASSEGATEQPSFSPLPAAGSRFESLPPEGCGKGTPQVFSKTYVAPEEPVAMPMHGDLASMLRNSADILERDEKMPNSILFETIRGLAGHGSLKSAAVQQPNQSYVGSLGDEFDGSGNLLGFEPMSEPNLTEMMFLKGNDEHHAQYIKDPLTKATDAPQGDNLTMFDGGNEKGGNGTHQMPWTTTGDFIRNAHSKDARSDRGGNVKSDAASAAKTKGDLRSFINFADNVQLRWKQADCKTGTLPGDYQMTQCGQELLLLRSVRQFIEYLKEKETEGDKKSENAKPRFKFPQYKRMLWVLDNTEGRESVAEIMRMLVLCSVVVSNRDPYGKRDGKRKRN